MKEVKAKDIKEGMLVDLEGDKFADPNKDNSLLRGQYMTVDAVKIETDDCICIHFDDFDAVGFPLEHTLHVRK